MRKWSISQVHLINLVLERISNEQGKSLVEVRRLLLIEQDLTVNSRFWELLESLIPGHPYMYVGRSGKTMELELRKELTDDDTEVKN